MRRLALLLALLAAAPAQAASVRVATTQDDGELSVGGETIKTVVFRAAPGERNRVDIRQRGRTLRVHDRDVRLHSGPGCRSRNAHLAVCSFELAARRLQVALGDRDDSLDLHGAAVPATVSAGRGGDGMAAGSGDDTLSGGPGDDVAFGKQGVDRLSGGAGDDVLEGDNGDDTLTDGPGEDLVLGNRGADELVSTDRGHDTLRGGPGTDRVSYARQRKPVTVLLDPGTGAGDRLIDIENVLGSRYDDDLVGDNRPNVIDGGPGADVMDGQGRGDRFRTEGFDDIDCGNGDDAVLTTDSADYLVEPDCEAVNPNLAGGPVDPQPVAVSGDAVTMRLPCGSGAASLVTAPGPRRYDTQGPFDVTVATGTCDQPLTLTDQGRALARPAVVGVRFGDAGWFFRLPPAP